jgi:hypothetical protein
MRIGCIGTVRIRNNNYMYSYPYPYISCIRHVFIPTYSCNNREFLHLEDREKSALPSLISVLNAPCYRCLQWLHWHSRIFFKLWYPIFFHNYVHALFFVVNKVQMKLHVGSFVYITKIPYYSVHQRVLPLIFDNLYSKEKIPGLEASIYFTDFCWHWHVSQSSARCQGQKRWKEKVGIH